MAEPVREDRLREKRNEFIEVLFAIFADNAVLEVVVDRAVQAYEAALYAAFVQTQLDHPVELVEAPNGSVFAAPSPEAALAAAARDLADAQERHGAAHGSPSHSSLNTKARRVRSALAALAAPRPEPLDVERLDKAIRNVFPRLGHRLAARAEVLAREYAALAPSEPTDG